MTKQLREINQIQKRKFLILVSLLKKQIIMLNISGLAANAALTIVENEIPNISSLVKKKQIMTQKLLKLKKTY